MAFALSSRSTVNVVGDIAEYFDESWSQEVQSDSSQFSATKTEPF
jgi:hypothetical protein